MNSKKKILIALGACALLVLWFLIPKQTKENNASAHASRALFKVKTQVAKEQKIQPFVLFNGVTVPSLRVALHPQSGGTVRKILVPEGKIVERKVKLIDLSKGSKKQNVIDKEAALEKAKIYHEGYSKLFEKGYISKANLLTARSDVKKAEYNLHLAKVSLSDRAIYAPFKGSVSEYLVKVGDTMNYQGPSQAICGYFIQLDPLEVEIHANQKQIPFMHEGLKADIIFDTGEVIHSALNFVKPETNKQTQKYRMTMLFSNPDNRFQAGVSVKVRVFYDQQEAVSVPQSAISYDADHLLIGVKILGANGTVSFKPIKIIHIEGDVFWIQGVSKGEKIIIQGGDFVRDGEKVTDQTDGDR